MMRKFIGGLRPLGIASFAVLVMVLAVRKIMRRKGIRKNVHESTTSGGLSPTVITPQWVRRVHGELSEILARSGASISQAERDDQLMNLQLDLGDILLNNSDESSDASN
ncbi:hypothetical protein HKD24_09230 [Gluconobacter sp. LMG 31484]|uniref:Uncharacterized protein n=1 Tax=Gluconobacter vitians TaxID=2728102 RepID=A0ABR9Y634_9PROT|nr:hypothetical protein [Gluconobacter vitians]MBF0859395.1 hypothetical protein [Gluconobacter vitians]